MRKFLNIKFLLLLVVILAAVLRFYNIGINPPSLTWDETAWGYNAYSLGLDGKDEFGKFLPVQYIESFGDFKPPVYAYLDVIPVKLLGLNEFATRVPSALFGTITVLLTYFLVIRLFPKSRNKELLGLISAFFLAVSPWHIMLSRAAFEANVATFFIVVGVWSFLAGVQDKKWYLLISAASFVASMYTFNTSRIVSPLLVILFFIIFRKRLWELKKQTITAVILGILLILPLVPFLITPQAQLRFKEVNIFTDSQPVETANKLIEENGNALWAKVMFNRRIFYGLDFVKHYFDNLSPNFLFGTGDPNPKFSIQEVGEMYIFDIPFIVLGILFLIRKKEDNYWLIPVWLLLGIIPAATARETPHALRIETTLPTFQILAAYGFIVFIDWSKNIKSKLDNYNIKLSFLLPAIACLLLLFNILYFLHNLFVHYPVIYSSEWQYGYKESINYVKSVQDKFDKVVVTNSLGRPYIYYLFYTKEDPNFFRQSAKIERSSFGFVTVQSYGKYVFPKEFDYDKYENQKVLFIATSAPDSAKILKTFYNLNGTTALVAYTL